MVLGDGPRVRVPLEEAMEWYRWSGTGEDSLEGYRRRDPCMGQGEDRRLLPPGAALESHIFRPKETPF